MRLIDADALCKTACDLRCGCEPDECEYEDDNGKYCEIAQFIEYAPTIEAVPLKPLAKTVMSPAEFLEALKEIDKMAKKPRYDDLEQFHSDADDLMCKILRDLGYGEGIDFFENHERWYA